MPMPAQVSQRQGAFLYETYAAPRAEARQIAKDYFARFPRGGYMTVLSRWRQLADGRIEFTMSRLPTG